MYNRYKTFFGEKRKVMGADILPFHATRQKTYFNGMRKLQLCSISHNCILHLVHRSSVM
jgi:hypothetical protein